MPKTKSVQKLARKGVLIMAKCGGKKKKGGKGK